MKATCVKPASPLAENAFSPNQSGKLGKMSDSVTYERVRDRNVLTVFKS